MSTYDTFLDPQTGQAHQSKAFGKRMKAYRPGDTVRPQRAPLSKEDYAAFHPERWEQIVDGLTSATLQSRIAHADGDEERYIDVSDGVYTGISAARDPSIPLVDHYGRLVEED